MYVEDFTATDSPQKSKGSPLEQTLTPVELKDSCVGSARHTANRADTFGRVVRVPVSYVAIVPTECP
jgi:hypothetical protein